MTRAAINWILDSNHKSRRWIAAGIVVLGIGGMNQNSTRGPLAPQAGGRMPITGDGASIDRGHFGGNNFGGNNFGGNNFGGGQMAPQPMGENAPVPGGYIPAPQAGGFTPAPAVQAQETTVPSSGDSVPESVNTNFSDYMRDQQRVVSENDGQTYIVNSNADPNQMTDTRDSVSGFTQAAPGSEAAGYAEVAPSGATTVDTSTATPVDTSSSTSAPAAE